MDADPPPRTGRSPSLTPEHEAPRGRDLPHDSGDAPYAPASLFHSTAPLLGGLIGLLMLVVPLASVL
ncbi:MAG: hypothetical protein RLZZ611_144, partial [Cyanobacteriota bacterium]